MLGVINTDNPEQEHIKFGVCERVCVRNKQRHHKISQIGKTKSKPQSAELQKKTKGMIAPSQSPTSSELKLHQPRVQRNWHQKVTADDQCQRIYRNKCIN